MVTFGVSTSTNEFRGYTIQSIESEWILILAVKNLDQNTWDKFLF